MRLVYGSALAIALAALVPLTPVAQAQDANRTVAGGGITAKGWQGKADGSGQVSEAKLSEEGKDLHVIGSPGLVRSLLARNLLDELRLTVDPLVLGGGKRLFPDDAVHRPMRLLDSEVTSTGAIILTYTVTRAG